MKRLHQFQLTMLQQIPIGTCGGLRAVHPTAYNGVALNAKKASYLTRLMIMVNPKPLSSRLFIWRPAANSALAILRGIHSFIFDHTNAERSLVVIIQPSLLHFGNAKPDKRGGVQSVSGLRFSGLARLAFSANPESVSSAFAKIRKRLRHLADAAYLTVRSVLKWCDVKALAVLTLTPTPHSPARLFAKVGERFCFFASGTGFFVYDSVSHGVNLHRLGCVVVRLVRVLQHSSGPFVFYHQKAVAGG